MAAHAARLQASTLSLRLASLIKDAFRHLSIQQKLGLVREVNKIVQCHTTRGFSAYLYKKDYDQHYIAGDRPAKIQLDTMYGVCFRMCLSFAIGMAQDVVAWENPQIKFILEAGHANAKDAERVFKQVKDGVPELRTVLDSIAFVERMPYTAYREPMLSPMLRT